MTTSDLAPSFTPPHRCMHLQYTHSPHTTQHTRPHTKTHAQLLEMFYKPQRSLLLCPEGSLILLALVATLQAFDFTLRPSHTLDTGEYVGTCLCVSLHFKHIRCDVVACVETDAHTTYTISKR